MYQAIKSFKSRLAAGNVCLGAAITLSDPAVSEALGKNVDFFWIDLEHTPLGLESLQSHLISARATNVPAIVRVPGSETWFIKRVLDTGAQGIVVPQVRSAAEVKSVVDACRYKPMGDRGYGPRRASNYGRHDQAYLKTISQELFVSVQIENVDGLRELDEIVKVPGLDSLVIGPFDLSASMGLIGQVAHPEVMAAMQRIVNAARSNGLFVGLGGPADEDYVMRAAGMGVQWIQAGSDFGYMIQFMEERFASITSKLGALRSGPSAAGKAGC